MPANTVPRPEDGLMFYGSECLVAVHCETNRKQPKNRCRKFAVLTEYKK